MSAVDIILGILLAAGLILSLPIWWWLFGAPLVRLCRCVFGEGGRAVLRLRVHRAGSGRQRADVEGAVRAHVQGGA